MIRHLRNIFQALIIILLFSLQQNVLAGVSCEQNTLLAGEKINTYLTHYYSDCINYDEIRAEFNKGWNILFDDVEKAKGRTDKEIIANYRQLVPAWASVSNSFKAIATDKTTPELKLVYDSFSVRAAAAGSSLKATLDGSPAKDKALFRADTWTFTKLVLPDYSQVDEETYPLIDTEVFFMKQCLDNTSDSCKTALRQGKALMQNWAKASVLATVVSSEVYLKVFQSVQEKDKLWNTYLYDSKPMWPLDLMLTDKWNHKTKDGFPVPPKTQYFFMHPSVSFEYAQSAADGQQLKPVLFLELIGFNWWNIKDRPHQNIPLLKYFSGASIIASYADRAGIKDNGYGALLTFNNVYSIGISRYGKDTALSVSLDFANLFRERLKGDYWLRRSPTGDNANAD